MIVLGSWIKQIVAIILISIIAEMLLPTKATQKYVRAVLGIAVIAAMIQPLMPMLHRNWANEMANAVSTELTSTNTSQTGGDNATAATPSYEQTLQAEQTRTADTLLANAMKEAMPRSLSAHVTALSVHGATTPATMTVVVALDQADVQLVQRIQTWVGGYLHISSSQVQVA